MAIGQLDRGLPVLDAEERSGTTAQSSLPLVSWVLGIAGVVLGITVIWYFAAIPIGLLAAASGLIALRHIERYDDAHARTRATVGAVLGLVAIVLGVTAAYFLPRVMERADNFLASLQDDVNGNVREVSRGLRGDVDRLDRTVTRDLARFEAANREELIQLEQRTAAALTELGHNIDKALATATAGAEDDLRVLEAQIKADLRGLEATLRETDTRISTSVASLETRLTRLEKEVGLAP